MRPSSQLQTVGARLPLGTLSFLLLLSCATGLSAQAAGQQTPPPSSGGIFLLIGVVFVVIVGIAALGSASSTRSGQEITDHNPNAGSASVTILAHGGSPVRTYQDQPAAPKGRLATASDIANMLADLEEIDQADWLTRGLTKRLIVRKVEQRTEVAEAYERYFCGVNHVLAARRDLEQTKRELEDFELTQSLRQKRLEVESAELDAKIAKLELLKLEAQIAKEGLKTEKYTGPVRREDYEL